MFSVARLALFDALSPAQVYEAEHNLTVRLVPTIVVQPGFIAGIWAAQRPDMGFSFASFANPDLAQAAGQAVNSAPLLAEQNPANLPQPSEVIMGPVLWEHLTTKQPQAVRLDFVTQQPATAASELFAATVASHPAICRAYLVNEQAMKHHLLLTLWSDVVASEKLAMPISPDRTLSYTIILHNVQGQEVVEVPG